MNIETIAKLEDEFYNRLSKRFIREVVKHLGSLLPQYEYVFKMWFDGCGIYATQFWEEYHRVIQLFPIHDDHVNKIFDRYSRLLDLHMLRVQSMDPNMYEQYILGL
jgi:hypothetical protein